MRYLSIIFAILAAAPVLSQEIDFYRLRSEVLECIIENIDLYREMGELIYVDAEKCPPEGEASILENLVNEIPNTQFAEEYDSFLVLTAPNLECLSELTIETRADAYRFYPDQCRIEVE